jgi:DNA processing protein
MKHWKEYEIKKIEKSDNRFPRGLLELKDCPKYLYYRGKWREEIFERCLGVVGSRKISHYGRETIEMVIPYLVRNKYTIVSGFMSGVDSESHIKCLEYGGETVAVMGSGLDWLYPKENGQLYDEIIEKNGLVISEYEPNFQPTRWSFPQRNRLVAALARKGLIVIEAGKNSGSLITANLAVKYGIPLWAVPGNIFGLQSSGTNQLIKESKARMLTVPEDLEAVLGKSRQESLWGGIVYSDEDPIVSLIRKENGLTLDEIVKGCRISAIEAAQRLTLLTLDGQIHEDKGVYFAKIHTPNRESVEGP